MLSSLQSWSFYILTNKTPAYRHDLSAERGLLLLPRRNHHVDRKVYAFRSVCHESAREGVWYAWLLVMRHGTVEAVSISLRASPIAPSKQITTLTLSSPCSSQIERWKPDFIACQCISDILTNAIDDQKHCWRRSHLLKWLCTSIRHCTCSSLAMVRARLQC